MAIWCRLRNISMVAKNCLKKIRIVEVFLKFIFDNFHFICNYLSFSFWIKRQRNWNKVKTKSNQNWFSTQSWPSASWAIDSEPIRARGIIEYYFTISYSPLVKNAKLHWRLYSRSRFVQVVATGTTKLIHDWNKTAVFGPGGGTPIWKGRRCSSEILN